jgi:hypothetical protein
MLELSKDNLLRSWKEIAAYLGVDVRTCHRWEARHGMPVHRAEGSEKRSNVFAYKDELDAWFRRTFRPHNGTEAVARTGKHRPWVKWTAAAFLVFGLAGVLFLLLPEWLGPKGQPADFAIEGSELVILDKKHRELWRWDSKMEDLEKEPYYREHFQVKDNAAGNILPDLVIKDIDADGDVEVLFAPKRVNDQTGEGVLYCLDRKGRERWDFPAGRELRCGGKVFSPDYRVAGFHPHDIDGDGRLEIVVEAFHAPDWPCQLALLDADGKLIGEYWNAGYLRDTEYYDLDGDGREELLVVGVNKEHRSGCLIVLDTRRMAGGSPQSGGYVCEGIGPGTELHYVVTLPCEVAEAMGDYVADLLYIEVTANRRIRATSTLGLIYEFDLDLKPLQVSWGDGYKAAHKKLFEEGKVSIPLGPDYERRLLDGIRWWNGKAMVPEPSRNMR